MAITSKADVRTIENGDANRAYLVQKLLKALLYYTGYSAAGINITNCGTVTHLKTRCYSGLQLLSQ